jgi:transposase
MLKNRDKYYRLDTFKPSSTLASSALHHGPVEIDNIDVHTTLLVHQVLRNVGLWRAVDAWCQDEGDVPPGKVVEALVQCRLQNELPVPLHLAEGWFGHSLVPHLIQEQPEKLNEFRLGRVLERVGRTYEAIWADVIIAATRHYKLDWGDVLYDLTSIHFEGAHEESDLARRGHSRDQRPESKQITIGLDYSASDKLPLLYKVHPGNTTDVTTVKSNVASLLEIAKIVGKQPGDLTVVGDRALLTPELIRDYVECGVHYLGSMQPSKTQEEFLAGFSDDLLKRHPLAYQPKGKSGGSYYAVRSKFTIPPTKRGRKLKGISALTQDALIVLSMGRRIEEWEKRQDILRRAEERLDAIAGYLNKSKYTKLAYVREQVQKALSQHGIERFLLTDITETLEGGKPVLRLSWKRDLAAIKAAEEQDGKFLVLFNLPTELGNDEIFAKLKKRDIVERGAGHLKNDIRVRPIYLQNDDRILGLAFVCMVALFVTRVIERELRRHSLAVTFKQVDRIFEHHHASLCTFEDLSQHVRFRRPTTAQKQIMEALFMDVEMLAPFVVGENTQFSNHLVFNQSLTKSLANPPPDS